MALDGLVSDTRSRKRQQWENEDITNTLPEVIIQHIISFLPTKDAVRTSVLSKRWEYLWVSLPSVEFYLDSAEALNFVDRALFLCDSTLKRFSLEGGCRFDDVGRLRNWITAMVRRNVQELQLNISIANNPPFKFPYCLFSCASLTRLSLTMWDYLTLPPSVHLLNLKHLVLKFVIFNDVESVDNLFTGCPMLETTRLIQCGFQIFKGNIRVSAPKLGKLEFHEDDTWDDDSTNKVTIFGPCLKSFHLKGRFRHSYRLNGLPSLDEAIISMENLKCFGWRTFLRRLHKVLKKITHVRNLTFSCGAIEALNYQKSLLLEVPIFNNLCVLSFDHDKAIELDDSTGLMKILQNCSCLTTLRFEGGVILSSKEEEKILNPVPPCLMSCLKKIEILFDNDYENQKLCRNAAKVLLKRASVLEKLIVYLPNQYALKYSPAHPMDREKFIKGLIEQPRASKVCQIEFMDSEMKSI